MQAQELFLQLIAKMGHNDLPASRVAMDLRDNPTLWDAAMPGCYDIMVKDMAPHDSPSESKMLLSSYMSLMLPLRDMDKNFPDDEHAEHEGDYWHGDTVLILVPADKQQEAEKMFAGWHPDEVHELTSFDKMLASQLSGRLLYRIWWD